MTDLKNPMLRKCLLVLLVVTLPMSASAATFDDVVDTLLSDLHDAAVAKQRADHLRAARNLLQIVTLSQGPQCEVVLERAAAICAGGCDGLAPALLAAYDCVVRSRHDPRASASVAALPHPSTWLVTDTVGSPPEPIAGWASTTLQLVPPEVSAVLVDAMVLAIQNQGLLPTLSTLVHSPGVSAGLCGLPLRTNGSGQIPRLDLLRQASCLAFGRPTADMDLLCGLADQATQQGTGALAGLDPQWLDALQGLCGSLHPAGGTMSGGLPALANVAIEACLDAELAAHMRYAAAAPDRSAELPALIDECFGISGTEGDTPLDQLTVSGGGNQVTYKSNNPPTKAVRPRWDTSDPERNHWHSTNAVTKKADPNSTIAYVWARNKTRVAIVVVDDEKQNYQGEVDIIDTTDLEGEDLAEAEAHNSYVIALKQLELEQEAHERMNERNAREMGNTHRPPPASPVEPGEMDPHNEACQELMDIFDGLPPDSPFSPNNYLSRGPHEIDPTVWRPTEEEPVSESGTTCNEVASRGPNSCGLLICEWPQEANEMCVCEPATGQVPPDGGCTTVNCAPGTMPTPVGNGCTCIDGDGEPVEFPPQGVGPQPDPFNPGAFVIAAPGVPGDALALPEHTAGDPVIGTWSGDACLLPAGHRHSGNTTVMYSLP